MSVVRTILLYGCETWPLRVEDQRRFEVFDNGYLRRILGRRQSDRVSCNALRHHQRQGRASGGSFVIQVSRGFLHSYWSGVR